MNEIPSRIEALRFEMLNLNLDACYISGTDPHANEYLPKRWQTREFISGFTGSYGVIVITNEEAGLWTDTRYFLQAEEQLKGTGIKMYKLRVPNSIAPDVWLTNKLSEGSKVGIDAQTISISGFRNLKNTLNEKDIELVQTNDLFNKIWRGRPEIPENKVFELGIEFAGFSRVEKKNQITDALKKYGADSHIVTTLDELAWTFNLRGSDIDYNPVFTGFGVVGKNESVLFVDKNKISPDLKVKLEKEKIVLLNYNQFYSWLKSVKNKTFFVDPSSANYAVFEALKNKNNVVEGTSEISFLKARKNNTELAGFKQAMKKDGVALIEFLFWLKNNLAKGNITEYLIGRKLAEFRSKQEGNRGESFPPIVGYKSHGAIVHLSVDAKNAFPIEPEGILLFDSGGQYLEGTTDITRTVALGKISDQQKNDYTLVLKGMIALSKAKFPKGTLGCHVDILARKPLWENGLNYGH
ncbi:MAG: M24 family metallopeptidase, partial [Prolixibacteraceae bacterium]|nr:M24 family metallopeptidase [Prolixibacteraceae bacterium]